MAIENFNLISAKSFDEQNDIENTLLAAIVQNETGGDAFISPTSWDDIDNMVDLGIAKKQIKIGDQFTCARGNETITWDVLGHNCDTLTDAQYSNRDNMTLCMHDIYTVIEFDTRQAFYATDEGLAAGTYNILISSQPWYNPDQGKYAQFTLTQPLPAGGQMVFTHTHNTTMFGATFSTYSGPTSTSPIESPIILEGSDGINLGTLTILEQTNINASQRAFFGSGNYKNSAIRQWLNSNAVAGSVWQPMTKFDRPPSWASTINGFMYGLDEDFIKSIKKTHIKVARNTLFESGGYDEMDDYFFLLSKPQVYGGATVTGVDEGSVYPYFENYSDLSAAGLDADKNRIKTKNSSAAMWWRLRSPGVSTGHYTWLVNVAGYVSVSAYAAYSGGIVAACTI